jgi:hypothetical protein
MTNLEWMQLQHYEKWRKRLQEDPYKTLFGASNDMLSGKGLNNWDWIHNSFPKWMLKDMGLHEQSQEVSKENTSQAEHTMKADKVDNSMNEPRARGSQPIRPFPRRELFEREGSVGIASPSDLRRPREGSHVKVVGTASSGLNGKGPTPPPDAPSWPKPPYTSSITPDTIRPAAGYMSEYGTTKESVTKISQRTPQEPFHDLPEVTSEEIARLQDFQEYIDRLKLETSADNAVNEEPPVLKHHDPTAGSVNTTEVESKAWRQTALQRRAASESAAVSKLQAEDNVERGNGRTNNLPIEQSEQTLPPQATCGASGDQAVIASVKERAGSFQEESTTPSKPASALDNASPARSTSQILDQLPKDDIDFLNAADIRATMGARRSRTPSDAQRQGERKNLEQAFHAVQNEPETDSMLEAVIKNNQYVRRVEREMREAKAAKEAAKTQATVEPVLQDPAVEVAAESSIDRMKKWLEITSTSFAKQFWQDPTEAADITKSKMFFEKISNYLKKGKAASWQIMEDLEKDVPASKALLKRLKKDGEILELAVHRVRQTIANGTGHDLAPRKARTMESLNARFHQTNSELEKAYDTLRELAGTEAVANTTGSFKRRLTVASKVLHKNAQLLRTLFYSLQTRLEDPKVDRNMLSNYKMVADNLLSLRDTQMTLVRLVDRAMSTHGVVPDAKESVNAIEAEQAAIANCDDPFVRARLALDAHLINEVQADKSTTPELRDDNTLRAQKPTTGSTLAESSHLAHSLFRPFGPAIEKLGSKQVLDPVAEKGEDEARRLGDLNLAEAMRTVYGNDYGLKSSQTATESEEVKIEEENCILEDKNSDELSNKGSNDTRLLKHGSTRDGEAYEAIFTTKSTPPEAPASEQPLPTTGSAPEPLAETRARSVSDSATMQLPTHYTILIRDPNTDTLSMTTSSTEPPRDISPAMPLHQALAALDSPASFVPHISAGLEVVSATKDMLVLRDALDNGASTRSFETVHSPSSDVFKEFTRPLGNSVNPIDGTARLSPTGYVGPEESPEQLEKEFQERRQAAGRFMGNGEPMRHFRYDKGKLSPGLISPRDKDRSERRGGRTGGVLKTAIWAAGICYVVGVVGEIATTPFAG